VDASPYGGSLELVVVTSDSTDRNALQKSLGLRAGALASLDSGLFSLWPVSKVSFLPTLSGKIILSVGQNHTFGGCEFAPVMRRFCRVREPFSRRESGARRSRCFRALRRSDATTNAPGGRETLAIEKANETTES
jgi:hypothetical protein